MTEFWVRASVCPVCLLWFSTDRVLVLKRICGGLKTDVGVGRVADGRVADGRVVDGGVIRVLRWDEETTVMFLGIVHCIQIAEDNTNVTIEGSGNLFTDDGFDSGYHYTPLHISDEGVSRGLTRMRHIVITAGISA